MKKATRTLVISGIALLAIGLTAARLSANKKTVEEKVYRKDPNSRIAVRAAAVTEEPFSLSNRYVGSFQPFREVTIAAETQGKILALGIKEGSQVGAGTLIAQVDNDLYKAQLYSAQASYENARTTLGRYQNAAVGDGVSEMQIDNYRLQMKSADAQVKQLNKQIAMSRINAPFGGIITAKYAEIGSMVSPGTQIARLSDISTLKLEIFVPEKELSFFREGAAIKVTSDVYPGIDFPGTVELVSASADAAHQFSVKIRVANNSSNPLKAGMYGTVAIDREEARALTIPRTALLGSAKKPQVFVAANGTATLRDVQVGRTGDAVIEVTGGLTAGETVIISGQVNLQNGSKVEILK